MMPVVALVTDFGLRDSYVAEVHLAIHRVVPTARVLDVTHGIMPYDRVGAALAVERTVTELPVGAALAVVVDPGVGSRRAAVATRHAGRWVVGPDNGVIPAGTCRRITWAGVPDTATTFDGRRLFGPLAAMLAGGLDPRCVGPETALECPWVLPPDAAFRSEAGTMYARGVVLGHDRYGNAVTSVRMPAGVRDAWVVEPSRWRGPVRDAYASVPKGDPVVLVGSSGRVELALREGTADVPRGTEVEVRCAG